MPAGFAYVQWTHTDNDIGADLVRILPGLFTVRPRAADLAVLVNKKELAWKFFDAKYYSRRGEIAFVDVFPIPEFASSFPKLMMGQAREPGVYDVVTQNGTVKLSLADDEARRMPRAGIVNLIALFYSIYTYNGLDIRALDATDENERTQSEFVTHFAYFRSALDAEEAQRELSRTHNLHARVDQSDDSTWSLVLTFPESASTDAMTRIGAILATLVEKHHGQYDGFESG